jgi:glycerophosphoryl diester phosphodiesterase
LVLNIAHRGFSGRYPENTLMSIRKAIDMGVDWIEIDAHLTKDNQIVVIHDPSLRRTTTGNGKVANKTLAEIRKQKTKKGRHNIPTLEEVFALINSDVKLNIEIKGFRPTWKVAELVRKHNMQDKVILSSGSISAMKIAQIELPAVKRAYVFYVSPNPKHDPLVILLSKLSFNVTHLLVLKAAEFSGANYVNLNYSFASRKFIKKLKSRGYKVNVWSVNTKPLMRKLVKNGADGIFTNYPNKLKAVLAEKPKKKKKLLGKISLKKIKVLKKLAKKK